MKPILVLCVDSFAKNILLIRNHLGLTNEEFCRQFEMEQWMLERIENGDPYFGFDIYLYFLHLGARAYYGLSKWWRNWDESDR